MGAICPPIVQSRVEHLLVTVFVDKSTSIRIYRQRPEISALLGIINKVCTSSQKVSTRFMQSDYNSVNVYILINLGFYQKLSVAFWAVFMRSLCKLLDAMVLTISVIINAITWHCNKTRFMLSYWKVNVMTCKSACGTMDLLAQLFIAFKARLLRDSRLG